MACFQSLCLFILIIAVQIFVPCTSKSATGELTIDVANFSESFDSAANVSGNIIVGVRLGEPTGKVAVNNIQFLTPPKPEVCVRINTMDGRFRANNIYKVTQPQENADVRSLSRLTPATLRFTAELSEYEKDHLAISAFLPTDGECQPSKSVYLPQIDSHDLNGAKLAVFVNSSSRDTELLVNQDGTKVSCDSIAGTRVTFDKKCTVQATHLKPGLNELTLSFDDGFASEQTEFIVQMPTK